MKRSSIWKLVGLAGVAGVAATGVAVARSERERRAYTPDEVRARLHDRLAAMEGGPAAVDGPGPVDGGPSTGLRHRLLRLVRRRSKRV